MSEPTVAALTGTIWSGDRERTQAHLLANVAGAASGFADMGIGANDAVAMMLRNDFAFFETTMAANTLGAQAVPVNWHFQAEEAGHILEDSKAKALVVHADLLPQIAAGIPAGVRVFVVPTPAEIRQTYGIAPERCQLPAGRTSWDEWISQQQARPMPPPPPSSSMLYTSGTTGKPKGVRREPLTELSSATFANMVGIIFGFTPGRPFRTVVTGPLYHAAPNAYGLWAARTGGFCILQSRFDPEDLLRLVEQHRITHLHMVPTMFVRLLKLPDEIRNKYDLSSLEFVVHAAAPCAPDVKRRMIEWWGPVICEYYGGTETGGVVFHASEEALRKPGTVGKALPNARIEIHDTDGSLLGPNQVGEIYVWLNGYSNFTYNGQDERRQAIERNGVISVGDVGYLDEDGYLFLCDRKNDMVISGGVNIYPAEIESVLIGMPGVHDCAVFGIPDEEFGESLCAYVEPLAGVTLEARAVRAFLASHLAKYKIPKTVKFQTELPREDSGKIFKRKLRAPYWEGTGRQI